eukprot:3402905-Pyramimonas_sp.AAC.1
MTQREMWGEGRLYYREHGAKRQPDTNTGAPPFLAQELAPAASIARCLVPPSPRPEWPPIAIVSSALTACSSTF